MMTEPHPRGGRRHFSTCATLSLSCLLLAACGEATAGSEGPSAAVRDSAGIRIVENLRAPGADAVGLRLAEAPEVDIGVVEGDSVYQLFRVSAATRLGDGRIAVANSGTSEVRIFGADGRFLSATGRQGEGPGEFRQLSGLWPLRGDSVLAWDAGLRRVTLLDSEGRVARQVTLEGTPSNPSLLRPLDDGGLFLVDERWQLSGPAQQDQFMEVTRLASDGTLQDSIGRFRFGTSFVSGSGPTTFVGMPGFSPRTDIVGTDDGFVLGYASEPEILSYSSDGELQRVIRWPDEERSVSPDHIALYKEEGLEGIEDDNRRRDRQRYYETIPYESRFPVYVRILPTRTGGLWVQRFSRPGEAEGTRWLVFDSTGTMTGEVTTPGGLRVFEVGMDYLLGVQLDELHVEHVRLYPLQAVEGAEEDR
jgi:6-bladed beta-propeller